MALLPIFCHLTVPGTVLTNTGGGWVEHLLELLAFLLLFCHPKIKTKEKNAL